MGKHRAASGETGVNRGPKSSLLDETNPLSYIPDGRNVQADYYRMANRDRQLAAIAGLSDSEVKYILGDSNATAATGKDLVQKAVQKIHEKDLIELRALVYL